VLRNSIFLDLLGIIVDVLAPDIVQSLSNFGLYVACYGTTSFPPSIEVYRYVLRNAVSTTVFVGALYHLRHKEVSTRASVEFPDGYGNRMSPLLLHYVTVVQLQPIYAS
jgi:hypothetical protein